MGRIPDKEGTVTVGEQLQLTEYGCPPGEDFFLGLD